MADYKMCEPFDIDHGELDGMSPQECFVLGVEWQKFYAIALRWKEGDHSPFRELCHSSGNLDRIKALLQRHGVPYRCRWLNDDWNELVGPPSCPTCKQSKEMGTRDERPLRMPRVWASRHGRPDQRPR